MNKVDPARCDRLDASVRMQDAASKSDIVRAAFAKIHPGGDGVPGVLREVFFELFRQGWSAASDYYGIVADGFGPSDKQWYIDRISTSAGASDVSQAREQDQQTAQAAGEKA